MKRLRLSRRVGGFTLMELLVVLAIIGILAALLLPALGQAKLRVQRAACVSQLREIGLAFHIFANDHRGRLPMQVPLSEGGSAESVRPAGGLPLTFRHFQPLSNELVTPKMLICASDTRLPAPDFAVLQNKNLSYFVNVAAEHGKATSILAGDRNLTNDGQGGSSLLRLDANSYLRWTHELHRFKGNLLFADSHVEEVNRAALLATPGSPTNAARLSMPNETYPSPVPVRSDRKGIGSPISRRFAEMAPEPFPPSAPTSRPVVSTNAPRSPVGRSTDGESVMGTFDLQLVDFLQRVFKWTYLLLLFLLLVYLAVRFWLWRERKEARQRKLR